MMIVSFWGQLPARYSFLVVSGSVHRVQVDGDCLSKSLVL